MPIPTVKTSKLIKVDEKTMISWGSLEPDSNVVIDAKGVATSYSQGGSITKLLNGKPVKGIYGFTPSGLDSLRGNLTVEGNDLIYRG